MDVKSRFQSSVVYVLQRLLLPFEEEVLVMDAGGYRVDILLQSKRVVGSVSLGRHNVVNLGLYIAFL